MLQASTNRLSLLVPAYFSSPTEWNRMTIAARRVPIVAILNPASGPGNQAVPGYQKVVNSLRSAGGQVIGYVSTRYSDRPASEVESEVAKYYQWYVLDGIFLDEMSNTLAERSLAYYATLSQRLRALHPGAKIIGNPGIQLPERYRERETADVWVTFEVDRGYENYRPDPWTAQYPSKQFAHLVYAIPESRTMTNYVRLACQRGAGWIYITDDSGANPWDRLPAYWDALVNEVERVNLGQRPEARIQVEGQETDRLHLGADAAPGVWTVEHSGGTGAWQPQRELYFRDVALQWVEPIDASKRLILFRLRR